ncbi:hypothetical protein ANN_20902 [Periplaneta americana]|uniref:Uncharacterized protein n=1 Tax=Periplaneta americana TaxID=6978 RepID=A0ABQ8SDX5_PERAM|nr:hypothetical protein ANN_20902 [Periplaneta americana]
MLQTCRRSMERKTLQLSLRNKVRNEELRNRTGMKDVLNTAESLKWKWGGHVTKAVLLVITIIATLVIAQDSPNPSPELCKEICNNPREVKCPGPADASECRSDQVFKANGSLCGCCNACYTKRDQQHSNCLQELQSALKLTVDFLNMFCKEKYTVKQTIRDIKIVGRSIWRSSNEKTQVYAWHKRFSGGRDSIKDDVRSGRPTTATNEAIAQRVRNVVTDDRRKTIKEIAAEVGISIGSVHNVLHKHLNMHYVSQKLVPKMLSAEQKETRMTLAGDMISMADEDGDFLNKIIAGDETWCNLYDPVPKRQSSEWKSKHLLGSKNFLRSLPKAKLCWKFSSTLGSHPP